MSNVFSGMCNVSQDATVNYLPSGSTVLNFNAANNIGFGDNQKTNWLRIAVWGKRAEGNLKDYLKKGQAVFISGEMSTNEYTKQDGSKGFQIEITANVVDLIGGKKSDNAQPAYESYQQDPYPPAAYAPPQPVPQYQTPHQQHRQAVAQHNVQQAQAYQAQYAGDMPF